MAWLREVRGGVEIDLLVAPGAARTAFAGAHDNRLKLRVAAPPVDGKANNAVTKAIARALGVPKSTVEVARGRSSRRKTVRVVGVTTADVNDELGEASE